MKKQPTLIDCIIQTMKDDAEFEGATINSGDIRIIGADSDSPSEVFFWYDGTIWIFADGGVDATDYATETELTNDVRLSIEDGDGDCADCADCAGVDALNL